MRRRRRIGDERSGYVHQWGQDGDCGRLPLERIARSRRYAGFGVSEFAAASGRGRASSCAGETNGCIASRCSKGGETRGTTSIGRAFGNTVRNRDKSEIVLLISPAPR